MADLMEKLKKMELENRNLQCLNSRLLLDKSQSNADIARLTFAEKTLKNEVASLEKQMKMQQEEYDGVMVQLVDARAKMECDGQNWTNRMQLVKEEKVKMEKELDYQRDKAHRAEQRAEQLADEKSRLQTELSELKVSILNGKAGKSESKTPDSPSRNLKHLNQFDRSINLDRNLKHLEHLDKKTDQNLNRNLSHLEQFQES